jgi:lysyl-tRNA synthetase class 1
MGESMHWADMATIEDLKISKQKHIVASGITPSGNIHIGNMRGGGVRIPFRHMVTAVQIADLNFDNLLTVLQRGGYDIADTEKIRQKADNALNWLRTYAPQIVKFKVQDTLPAVCEIFNELQRQALGKVAERFLGYNDGQAIHEGIYAIAEELNMDPRELFETIYQSILGTRTDPRLGYFLLSLDKDFVIERFIAASKAK